MKKFQALLAATFSLSTLMIGGCMSQPDATPEDDTVEVSSLSCGAPALEVITVGRENRFGLPCVFEPAKIAVRYGTDYCLLLA